MRTFLFVGSCIWLVACGGVSLGNVCGDGTHSDDRGACVANQPVDDAGAHDDASDSAADGIDAADGGTHLDSGGDAASDDANTAGDAAAPLDFRTACLISDNALFVNGDPQDFIHPGPLFLKVGPGWQINSDAYGSGVDSITIFVGTPTTSEQWTIDVASWPLNAQLAVQTYGDVRAAHSSETGHAQLAVSGEGRACNAIGGWFEVASLTTTQTGPTLVRDVTIIFEQHCELATAALRGCIHLRQ